MSNRRFSLINKAGAVTSINDITDVTVTAAVKGDILVYDGTAWVDLAVGANDQILTADSAETTGIKWAAAAGGIADGTVTNSMLRWNGSAWVEVTDALLVDSGVGAESAQLHLTGNQSTTTSQGSINVDVGGSGDNILRMHDGHPTIERGFLLTAEYTLSAANRTIEFSSYGSGSATNQPLLEMEYDGWIHLHNRQTRFNTDGSMFLAEKTAAATDIAGFGQLWVRTATPNELWFTDDAGNDTQIV